MNKSQSKDIFTIAIIGAPNVGKSTLFNRLIGGRRSIVEDMRGVTRDRIYADINLARFHEGYKNLQARVIDTGGLFFEDDSLYEGVQRQAERAMEEADIIIFMVDGRAGVTTIDSQITDIMRQSTKPTVLLVNKIDSEDLEHLSAEFYSLGFTHVLPFSNLSGAFRKQMKELVNTMRQHGLQESEGEYISPYDSILKIALLGKPNTGKSSLLNRICGYNRALVHDKAGTTRDALDTLIKHNEEEVLLIDTAGLRRKTKVYEDIERYMVDRSIKSLVRADVTVLVMDVTQSISHQEEKLASLITKRQKGCIIVLNKWDLIEEKDYDQYMKDFRARMPYLDYAPCVITSAVDGIRHQNIIKEARKVYENLNRQIKTKTLNTAIHEIVAVKRVNSKLKVYFSTQISMNPVIFRLYVNDPKYVDKNYLQFLERQLRQEFEFAGVPFGWEIVKSGAKSLEQDASLHEPQQRKYRSKR